MKRKRSEMTQYRFYKEKDICWYIDLPDYTGKQEDLMMVAGADRILDDLSKGKDQLWLEVSETRFKGCMILKLEGLTENEGADYLFGERKLWLCRVTDYVFGYYPEKIFFKPVTKRL